jgi:hypothetical protein
MDDGKIDAVIFPTWAQLPVVNGGPHPGHRQSAVFQLPTNNLA